MNFLQDLKEFLLFDGAMGTMIQRKNLTGIPELYAITNPEDILEIHKLYVEAGSHVITSNTFQANRVKLEGSGYTPAQIIQAAVKLAKKANPKYVALDMGPTGQLMEPVGEFTFEEAYELYKEQVIAGVSAGADLILVETLSDLYEAKAAILAAKENSNLPVICSFTFQEDGRTFLGTTPETVVLTLQGLGVDAIGLNCSLGPKELLGLVSDYVKYAKVPILVQPNAGMPREEQGQTTYDISPEEFSDAMKQMAQMGVKMLGGCCGTSPEYIRLVIKSLEGLSPQNTVPRTVTAVTSSTKTVFIDDGITLIGERINPTGKKKLKEALRSQNLDYIIGEAIDQVKAGADILDVNAGLPEIDEPAMLRRLVKEISAVTSAPLQIDSADPVAIEAAARVYNGRPLINSVNGKQEVMDAIFPIAKKYGAVLVGLALDDDGIPETASGRLAVARKIIDTAARYGIPREDILIDCLVLTASSHQKQVIETVKAITEVKRELGVKTVLGVSNVSFGMPNRPLLNSAFLAATFGAGLNAPIINPLSKDIMDMVNAFKVINGQDVDGERFIAAYSGGDEQKPVQANTTLTINDIIIEGRKEEARGAVSELLKSEKALEIVDKYLIPSLDVVGDRYERGEIFLPQLIRSAETVKNAFDVLKSTLETDGTNISKGKILLATVKGDIHDIGKNIVKVLLENYGYEIVDLGKDVAVEDIVDAAKREDIKLIGLSALMTTTVRAMKETIDALKASGLTCKVMVGGAVLNPEYAELVGADFYAKDARDGIEIASKVFGDLAK